MTGGGAGDNDSDLFDGIFGDAGGCGDAEAAALLDEFSGFMDDPPAPLSMASRNLDKIMVIPMVPVAAPAPAPPPPPPPLAFKSQLSLMVPILGGLARRPLVGKSASATTEYRRLVAIPRYLEKRKRRKWTKELMHPTRSTAAHRRLRNGGQFGRVTASFKPASEILP